MIILQLIGAIIQVLVFTVLPFVIYLIRHKTVKGFFQATGIYKTSASATGLGIIAGLIMGAIGIAALHADFAMLKVAIAKGTAPEQIRQLTLPYERIVVILIIAVIKTSLSEEILFRRWLTKFLIKWLGYRFGNNLQAFLFGILHVFLFWKIPDVIPLFLLFSFLLPGISGFIAGYLNERKGNGSIFPGWIMHAIINCMSYSFLVFIVS